MVFARKNCAFFAHAPQKNAAGSVVYGKRFAAVLINKEFLSPRDIELFYIAVEGERGIEAVDRIAEPDQVKSLRIGDGRAAAYLNARHGMTAGGKRLFGAAAQVARIVGTRIINQQNVHGFAFPV